MILLQQRKVTIEKHYSNLIVLMGLVMGIFFLRPESILANDKAVAQIASAQGMVEIQRQGKTSWDPAQLYAPLYNGDYISVAANSRASLLLDGGGTLNLGENTQLTLSKFKIFLLKLSQGLLYFNSNVYQKYKVETKYVVAGVEGTEFFIKTEDDKTSVTVFNGRVRLENQAKPLMLSNNQSWDSASGRVYVLVRSRDQVQWAIYYPPVIDWKETEFDGTEDWHQQINNSIHYYWKGDVRKAFSELEGINNGNPIQDGRFFDYRAALRLSVGLVEQAISDIEKAKNLGSRNALGLEAIVEVVKNNRDDGMKKAQEAVGGYPESPTSHIALSYALQANFKIEQALESVQNAIRLNPENALAHARLAELWLSLGYLDKAAEAADEAVRLNPDLARTQTVKGFSELTRIRIQEAKTAFETAIRLDQADPLPRLGMGLAIIREGDLFEGRQMIEVAASLDPNNSLIRSYLGKAYFEEKRDNVAAEQFGIAKTLDPKDPTPWFYSAIQKQTQNRPVEALTDLQKSIELNENRAVYRSRLMLDQDLAARSADLARIYKDLGFEQLALAEGWKSLAADPGNYSAHRFLADSYAALPRHEIARVSELLQSQLLQPININPVQPHLAESKPFIAIGAGPANASFNEYTPLFNRDRLALTASGVAGGNSTWGDEITQSGVLGKLSYSIGQFHYETDGFRENNDQEQDIYNFFAQMSLSHDTSVQAEYRYKEVYKGDLPMRFTGLYNPMVRIKEEFNTARIGGHHSFSPSSEIISSFICLNADAKAEIPNFTDSMKEEGYQFEFKHIYLFERSSLESGVGFFDADLEQQYIIPNYYVEPENRDMKHKNIYLYSKINYPDNIIWSLGASYDFFDSNIETDQLNPKLGFIWNPYSDIAIRASVFRVLKRSLISDQTVEPTNISGFNQFFDDFEGTDAWCYGLGIDKNFSQSMYAGAEYFRRELDVPFEKVSIATGLSETDTEEWVEDNLRAYIYWIPHPWFSISWQFQYEKFDRGQELNPEMFLNLETIRFPIEFGFSHPNGFYAKVKPTYVHQKGDFLIPAQFPDAPPLMISDDDQFWVFDISAGYRIPGDWGSITFEAKNIFNENFRFQDTDPVAPNVYPECQIYIKFSILL
jgi:tetratricopeptide (TPR) repeat protein